MRIVIADDEFLSRERLCALINELGIGEVVAEACNGREALEVAEIYDADVVLLDIRMPGMDGMKASEQFALLDPSPAVIFTTAYSHHALEAFDNKVVDYLLKPIRKDRLEQALKRAYRFRQAQSAVISPTPRARTYINYCQDGEWFLVPVSKISYFYACEKYIKVHWKEGEALISETLKDLEKEFAGQFLRIHRNRLVAVTHIIALRKGIIKRPYLILKDVEKPLEISRRHLQKVKQQLKNMRLPSSP